jgi:sodium transport system ATP-binding protein
LIEAENLAKDYKTGWWKSHRAVKGVSFTCKPGEVFGLLGPNGAGKTTILRMVSTALVPSEGTTRIDGVDVRRHPSEARARLGFLSGNTGLYGRLTGRETLLYFGRLHGMDDRALRDRIDALAETFSLASFLDKRCESLSTGMKQKINLSRALIHDPPALVLDEPTNGLDVITIRAMTRFIETERARGKTILLSTHQMNEVEGLCDRVGLIHHGRLCFTGTVKELRDASGGSLEEAFFRLAGAES